VLALSVRASRVEIVMITVLIAGNIHIKIMQLEKGLQMRQSKIFKLFGEIIDR
jgi:hypothetical protein